MPLGLTVVMASSAPSWVIAQQVLWRLLPFVILPEKALSTMFRSRRSTIKLSSLSFVCYRFIESCCWPGVCCSPVQHAAVFTCIFAQSRLVHFSSTCRSDVTLSLNSTISQPGTVMELWSPADIPGSETAASPLRVAEALQTPQSRAGQQVRR